MPALKWIRLQSVPSNPFSSPAGLLCLTCGSASGLSLLSLTGPRLEIRHRCRLSRVPISQTKETFNISHYLLLATPVIALKGEILKMEAGAVQFRCPTATPGLGRPTNETPGPARAANDHQPKLQDRVRIPSYQSFWLLNQLSRYIRAEARPTS